eukprot:4828024-Prymnesium_polylepis.1
MNNLVLAGSSSLSPSGCAATGSHSSSWRPPHIMPSIVCVCPVSLDRILARARNATFVKVPPRMTGLGRLARSLHRLLRSKSDFYYLRTKPLALLFRFRFKSKFTCLKWRCLSQAIHRSE